MRLILTLPSWSSGTLERNRNFIWTTIFGILGDQPNGRPGEKPDVEGEYNVGQQPAESGTRTHRHVSIHLPAGLRSGQADVANWGLSSLWRSLRLPYLLELISCPLFVSPNPHTFHPHTSTLEQPAEPSRHTRKRTPTKATLHPHNNTHHTP